jgi:hypothetical protein
MKKLIPLFFLVACKIDRQPNLAEVMVKAQQPLANCRTAKIGADVAICDIPTKDKMVQFLAVYGKDGFEAFPLKASTPQAPVAPSQPTPPTPPAPSGEGSGSNAPTK